MGAELARKREGKSTTTGMSEKQLKDFASKSGHKHKRMHRPSKVGMARSRHG